MQGSDTPLMLAGPHLIAMNLWNNAYLMPRILHQMLSLLSRLQHGTVFLSIYESNSGDSTGEAIQGLCQWLHGVLHPRITSTVPRACGATALCKPANCLPWCRGVASPSQIAS